MQSRSVFRNGAVLGFLLFLGTLAPNSSQAAASMSSAQRHNCIVEADGDLWCWGGNDRGQLGDGSRIDRTVPVRILPLAQWKSVSTAEGHTCGIRTNNRLYCWGDNRQFELGLGATAAQSVLSPTEVIASSTWVAVGAGRYHTCGVRAPSGTQGTLWCWGQNNNGQLGDGAFVPQPAPVQIGSASNWTAVAAGGRHSCALNAASTVNLYCWGANERGQLGIGNFVSVGVPTQITVQNTRQWISIVAGEDHSCGIQGAPGSDRPLFCWGANEVGQLGVNAPADANAPVSLGGGPFGGGTWASVAAGTKHTCALGSAGDLYCWGANSRGEIGNVTNNPQPTPAGVFASNTWASVAAGGQSTCAIASNGTPWCWGQRLAGQLGDGRGKQTPGVLPVIYFGLTWKSGPGTVAAAGNTACAISAANFLYCFGKGHSGQIGDNVNRDRPAPSEVIANTAKPGWIALAGGERQFCGIENNPSALLDGRLHQLWCWGASENQRLSTFYAKNQNKPVMVNVPALPDMAANPLTDWLGVSLGNKHGCAVAKFNAVYQRILCWGDASYGQVGSGVAGPASLSIRQVGTDADGKWRQVSSGAQHNCATKVNGTLWCWGSNIYGQLGIVFPFLAALPVQVGTATDWLAAYAGGESSCAIKTTGTLWCWGDNRSGQLGIGSAELKYAPTQVGTQTDWLTVAISPTHACGVRSTGGNAWYCWGSNGRSELAGNFSSGPFWTPVQIGGSLGWSNMTVSDDNSCSVYTPTNLLWCIGDNFYGQLGDDSAWAQHPAQVVFPP